jgi:hypothetical protein
MELRTRLLNTIRIKPDMLSPGDDVSRLIGRLEKVSPCLTTGVLKIFHKRFYSLPEAARMGRAMADKEFPR